MIVVINSSARNVSLSHAAKLDQTAPAAMDANAIVDSNNGLGQSGQANATDAAAVPPRKS